MTSMGIRIRWVSAVEKVKRRQWLPILALLCAPFFVQAQVDVAAENRGSYSINPGDVLSIFVWNEPTLSVEASLVRPDGFVSMPVLGELRAGERTITQLQAAIVSGLGQYLKDEPNVVVSVVQAQGSTVYVLGKVQRPGAFPLRGKMDVTQALAMAGGLNSFAAENSIRVLRRDKAGVQHSVKFKYGQIKDGDKLESNILLSSGDVVLVP